MQRRDFVDWVRGLAVFAMVIWHTADGWLAADTRVGQGWSALRFIGGLAAPSFLFLAGTGLALAARPGRAAAQPALHVCARGLEIVLMGYALRYQTWMIDAEAIVHAYLVRSWLPLGTGYLALFLSLRTLGTDPGRARKLALVGAALVLTGLAQVPWLAPGRLLRLLQVDVLQAIGASLVLLSLAERRFALLQRPWLAVLTGVGVALSTQVVWSLLPGVVPVPIAAYLGRFEASAGQPAPALFPLFPWFAYACFGAAFGTLLRRSPQDDRVVVLLALFGALLALCTSEAQPPIQNAIAIAPWCVHPLRVAFRTGLVSVLLLAGWSWTSTARGRLLVAFGRTSLRVYWAHLLVAYGSLGHPWHKQLSLGQWATRLVPLMLAMYLLTRVGAAPAVPREREAST